MIELNIRVEQTLDIIKQAEIQGKESGSQTEAGIHAAMEPYERKIKLYRILVTTFGLCYLAYSLSTIMFYELKSKGESWDKRF